LNRGGRSATLLKMARLLVVGLAAAVASTAVAVDGRASGDPKRGLTKADQHWAKTIVLRTRDLPTGVRWTSYSTGGPGGGAGTTPGCPGSSENNSDLTETGAALSPLFLTRNRQFIIASAAWIYKTTRQARAFVQRIEDGMTRCGAAALKAEVATTKSAELVSYGVRSIPGTHGWWNYRIVLRIHANGRTIKSFVDMGFGQRGRATSWLILHGAYEPLPASAEAKLVQLVMARMAKPPR